MRTLATIALCCSLIGVVRADYVTLQVATGQPLSCGLESLLFLSCALGKPIHRERLRLWNHEQQRLGSAPDLSVAKLARLAEACKIPLVGLKGNLDEILALGAPVILHVRPGPYKAVRPLGGGLYETYDGASGVTVADLQGLAVGFTGFALVPASVAPKETRVEWEMTIAGEPGVRVPPIDARQPTVGELVRPPSFPSAKGSATVAFPATPGLAPVSTPVRNPGETRRQGSRRDCVGLAWYEVSRGQYVLSLTPNIAPALFASWTRPPYVWNIQFGGVAVNAVQRLFDEARPEALGFFEDGIPRRLGEVAKKILLCAANAPLPDGPVYVRRELLNPEESRFLGGYSARLATKSLGQIARSAAAFPRRLWELQIQVAGSGHYGRVRLREMVTRANRELANNASLILLKPAPEEDAVWLANGSYSLARALFLTSRCLGLRWEHAQPQLWICRNMRRMPGYAAYDALNAPPQNTPSTRCALLLDLTHFRAAITGGMPASWFRAGRLCLLKRPDGPAVASLWYWGVESSVF